MRSHQQQPWSAKAETGSGQPSFPFFVCAGNIKVWLGQAVNSSTGRNQRGSSAAAPGCPSSLPTSPFCDLLSFPVQGSPGVRAGQLGTAGTRAAVAEGNIPNVAIYQQHGLVLV